MEQLLTIQPEGNWTASTTDNWVKITPNIGGETILNITTNVSTSNTSNDVRKCDINLNNEKVVVFQNTPLTEIYHNHTPDDIWVNGNLQRKGENEYIRSGVTFNMEYMNGGTIDNSTQLPVYARDLRVIDTEHTTDGWILSENTTKNGDYITFNPSYDGYIYGYAITPLFLDLGITGRGATLTIVKNGAAPYIHCEEGKGAITRLSNTSPYTYTITYGSFTTASNPIAFTRMKILSTDGGTMNISIVPKENITNAEENAQYYSVYPSMIEIPIEANLVRLPLSVGGLLPSYTHGGEIFLGTKPPKGEQHYIIQENYLTAFYPVDVLPSGRGINSVFNSTDNPPVTGNKTAFSILRKDNIPNNPLIPTVNGAEAYKSYSLCVSQNWSESNSDAKFKNNQNFTFLQVK